MEHYLPPWFDRFLQKNPTIMALLVIAVAITAALTLIASGRAIVAYEGF